MNNIKFNKTDNFLSSSNSRKLFCHKCYNIPFSIANDQLVLMLLCIYKAKIMCNELLSNYFIHNASIYKNDVKRICKRMINPEGTSFVKTLPTYKGLLHSINKSILDNLTEDELDMFLDAADYLDNNINDDMFKLRNACKMEVSLSKAKDLELFTETLLVYSTCEMVKSIYHTINENMCGNIYSLCKDIDTKEGINNAYKITCDDIDELTSLMKSLLEAICKPLRLTIPLSQSMKNGFEIIVQKIVSPDMVYGAADTAGVKIRELSCEESSPEYIKKKREEQAAAFAKEHLKTNRQNNGRINEKIDRLSEKGWKISRA